MVFQSNQMSNVVCVKMMEISTFQRVKNDKHFDSITSKLDQPEPGGQDQYCTVLYIRFFFYLSMMTNILVTTFETMMLSLCLIRSLRMMRSG